MPDPVPAGRNDDLDALAVEITESARVLADVEEAPAAEAWASGAVAEWYQLGGSRLAEVIASTDAAAAALIEWIESGRLPAKSDRPSWGSALGSARALRTSSLTDPDESAERVLVVTFEDSAGSAHDLSITICEDRISDVAAGPPGLIDDVLDAPEDSDGPDLRFVASPVAVDEALDELTSLVQSCDPRLLSPRARLDLPLLCRRLGTDPASLEPWPPDPEPVVEWPRDSEDDRYAADLVASALRLDLAAEPPLEVVAAVERFAARVDAGAPDAHAVLGVAGVRPTDVGLPVLARAVGAYLAPADLSVHPVDERVPISTLEPADWAGVILGLVRVVAANPLDGEECVQFINRCPEIATTIPARDAPMVAWAFDLVLYGWEVTGVLDDKGLLTPAGRWLLPRAAHHVWAGEAAK